MMDRRPIWAMPTWVPERIRSLLPDGCELSVVTDETDGSGDGSARVSTHVLELVRDADAYFGYGIPTEVLESGSSLRWVHSGAAGVGSSLTPQMLSRDVVFTNSAGIHAPPMAETVLGMILYFGRGLDFARLNQMQSRWDTSPFYAAEAPLRELSDTTIGIIGFGGIGREVARRLLPLGANVVAVARTLPLEEEPELTPVAGGGSLKARVLSGVEGLNALYAESDVIVLAAPETAETRGMIDAEALDRMRVGCVLINVARGKLVDEDALADALASGRVRGAGLDVFAKEPLSSASPLWELPNVLVTPHVSAVTRGFWKRECRLILRNLTRFVDDAPVEEWENVVDKVAGY